MKNKVSAISILIFMVFGGTEIFCAHNASAQAFAAKLPYKNGESFIVSQGYNSPPTHIHKDSYALDFTQNGCSAYGNEVLAAVPGKALLVEESGYNGGYGTELLILSDNNRVTRYAHLIPGSIPVKNGDAIAMGTVLGQLGNTGLVAGATCAEHPGTHLHFAMYNKNADGSFSAQNFEPISGFTNIIEGKWYVSDNMMPDANLLGDIGVIMAKVFNSFFNNPKINSATSVLSEVSLVPPVQSSTKIVMETSSMPLPTQLSSSSQNIIVNTDFGKTASDTNFSLAPIQDSSSQNENSASDTTIVTNASPGIQAVMVGSPSESSSSVQTSPQGQNNIPIPTGGVSVVLPIVASVAVLPAENSSTQISAIPSSTVPTDDNGANSTSTITESSSTPVMDASGTIASSSVPNSDDGSSSSTMISVSNGYDDGDGEASSTVTSSSLSFSLAIPIPAANAETITSFNSSTLAIDFAWIAPCDASGSPAGMIYEIFDLDSASDTPPLWTGTSTKFSYPISSGGHDYHFGVRATDSAGDTSLATTTVSVPDWFTTIQPVDDTDSHWSWYDDNWYDLGTGFYGTMRALTLEGYINDAAFAKSHLSLGEFLDPGYTKLNQQFTISDDAPFTNVNKKVTITGLNIPLQPNKYYRLYTDQDWQNRSVILKGTSATGTAMWDMFIYGAGGVQYKYPFYPYLSWAFVPNFPPFEAPNPPTSISAVFNPLTSRLDFSWPATTDPDTNPSLLTYETNCGTSTTPDPSNWQPVGDAFSGSCNIDPMKNYYVSVRTVDDLENISPPITQEWVSPITIPIAS